jgi:hypothetical protein
VDRDDRAHCPNRAARTTTMELSISTDVLNMFLGMFAIAPVVGVILGLLARALRGVV